MRITNNVSEKIEKKSSLFDCEDNWKIICSKNNDNNNNNKNLANFMKFSLLIHFLLPFCICL